MHKYIYRLVFTELGRIFLFQLFRSLRLLEDRWFTLEICFYAHCAHRYDRCSGKIFFFFEKKKRLFVRGVFEKFCYNHVIIEGWRWNIFIATVICWILSKRKKFYPTLLVSPSVHFNISLYCSLRLF